MTQEIILIIIEETPYLAWNPSTKEDRIFMFESLKEECACTFME